jgi:EAL domain-containing protein (putative c-di-GMP-specific phosphodiesterase class I)/GGDEF domain-containing protein
MDQCAHPVCGPAVEPTGYLAELRAILDRKALTPHFQPILDLRIGELYGFEGLIRGPSDSILHAPLNLLGAARQGGLLPELERACIEAILGAWAKAPQHYRIFVNLSPSALLDAKGRASNGTHLVEQLGLLPGNVVIELTESQPTFEYGPLLEAAEYLRGLGFTIALDDLGEGFSSLRLWSELRPEFIKVDKHFVQGVGSDPVKLHFLRSIHELANRTGARVIAEGIETDGDLAVIQELGIDFGQGFLLGRPAPQPNARQSPSLLRRLRPSKDRPTSRTLVTSSRATAERLLVPTLPVSPEVSNQEVLARFISQPDLQSLPVVQDGIPLGLLNRYAFTDMMSRPYSPELYGKRSCSQFMERDCLVVDQNLTIHALSERVVESDPRHILHGFILTRGGRYIGMGSGHDLIREITQMQLAAARYANPLTQLPGNVPIQDHLNSRLDAQEAFVVCYWDLDHFKPYNDVYGYRRGDELIQWTGKLLQEAFEGMEDFIGHVGGDDFITVLPEAGWEERVHGLLGRFGTDRASFFNPEDFEAGGYSSEDRKGQLEFHPLVTMSVGVVCAVPGAYANVHELAAAASGAKKMAKREPGCSCFLERRLPSARGTSNPA